jgi:hypothetical protein
MRRLKVAVAVLAAALLSCASAFAGAPTPVQWVDSNGNPITVQPGTKGLPANDQSRDRDFVLLQPNIISVILGDKNVCVDIKDGRDSSMMIQTRGYSRLRLRIRVGYPQLALCAGAYTFTRTALDSIFATTFGISVRNNTTAAWDTTAGTIKTDWRRQYPVTAGAVSVADSAGSLTEVMRLGIDDNPDYGEFVFVWPNIGDATIPATGAGLGTPNIKRTNFARDVDLVGRDGVPWVGDFTGIGVRMIQSLLDQSVPAAMNPGKPLFVTMDLLGSRD